MKNKLLILVSILILLAVISGVVFLTGTIQTILSFILMLSVLVGFHEFGHMIVAKIFKIYVKEYSIGMGPKIYSIKGKETEYSLRLLPLGGYCAMIDDINEDERELYPQERTFYNAKGYKRLLTLLAGPVFNLILACLICISVYQINRDIYVYPKATIQMVEENSPAEKAGLQANDTIYKIVYSDGITSNIDDSYDLIINAQVHKGDMTVCFERNGEKMETVVSPIYNEEEQRTVMGVTFMAPTVKHMNFFEACGEGIDYFFMLLKLTIDSIIMLITGAIPKDNISGTIGIYNYTSEALSYGLESYLLLCGNISISLAIMNLLPIPGLDGGKTIQTIIEMIIGKRLPKKAEEIINYVGLVLILALFIFSNSMDIIKLIKGEF